MPDQHAPLFARRLGVELEQVRDDLFLVAVEVHAVGSLHGGVEGAVGVSQVVEHLVRVVKGRERGIGIPVSNR